MHRRARAENRSPLRGLICFSLVGLFVRAFQLQAVQGESLASQAASQQEDIIEVPGSARIDPRPQRPAARRLGTGRDASTRPRTRSRIRRRRPKQVAKALESNPDEVLDAITQPGGFSYVDRKVDLKKAEAVEKLEPRRYRPASGHAQGPSPGRHRFAGDRSGQ